jgi:acyl transferase domain-containing protein
MTNHDDVFAQLAALSADDRRLLEEMLLPKEGPPLHTIRFIPQTLVGEPQPQRTWMLVGGAPQLVEQIAVGLRAKAESVTTASAVELLDSGQLPPGVDRVVVLPDEDERQSVESSSERLRNRVENETRLLLSAAHALARRGSSRLWVVTRGAQPVKSGAAVAGHASSVLWGLTRCLALEHPEMVGGLVDLQDYETASCKALVRELTASQRFEEVGIVGGERYVARLCASPKVDEQPVSLRTDRTYLVTGGLGGIGLQVASWLVDNGVRFLALMGRSAPSVEAENILADLRARGARVLVCRGDVASLPDVERVVREINDVLAPIAGVIHGAGVLRDSMFRDTDWTQCAAVFGPKVWGTYNLHLASRSEPLETFVMFSSVSSAGNAGQAAYAAANAYLDSFAHFRRACGLPAMSINWPGWSDVGMLASIDAREQARLRREGFDILSPSAGLTLFRRSLASDLAQSFVVAVDWPRFLASHPAGSESVLFRDLVADQRTARGAASGPLPQEKGATRQSDFRAIIDTVKAEARYCLGLEPSDPIDIHRPLIELGLTSLLANTLRLRVANALGMTTELIPATLAYDHPTIDAIAQYLSGLSTQDDEAQTPRSGNRKQTPSSTPNDISEEAIAIVGMACRLPGGVRSPEDLWRLLCEGVDGTGEMEQVRGAVASRGLRGGFLRDEVGLFDPQHFSISPREARHMDPQQQLLLEVAWEAFDHAGTPPTALAGSRTGVFATVYSNDFAMLETRSGAAPDGYSVTGRTHSLAAGRLSYAFGLRGPSMILDAACTSSLLGVHLARHSLLRHEIDLALVAAANVFLSHESFDALGSLDMLAADGHCKSYDASADGYARSEGVAAVVLKRLSDALAASDRILGVLVGSAVNHDGRSASLTAPNGTAQREVVESALQDAGISPNRVRLVEGMGTGSAMGDAIEVGALTQALGLARTERFSLGSLKANLGHTEPVAGLAGIMKAVLCLRHAELPPQIGFKTLGERIPLSSAALISTQRRPIIAQDTVAAVHAYGLSGTNAHVLLAGAPPVHISSEADDGRTFVFPLSARTEQSLRRLATQLRGSLRTTPSRPISEIAEELKHKAPLEHRIVILARDRRELESRLRIVSGGGASADANILRGLVAPGEDRTVIFAFGDTETSPEITEIGAELDKVKRLGGGDDTAVLWQYAMAHFLTSSGVQIQATAGVGVGEIIALAVAGVVSLEDAIRLVRAWRQVLAKAKESEAGEVDAADLESVVRSVSFREAEVKFWSSLTGRELKLDDLASPWTWQRMAKAAFQGKRPKPWAFGRETMLLPFTVNAGQNAADIDSLDRGAVPSSSDEFLRAVAWLWTKGVVATPAIIDRRADLVHPARLPPYPFDRRRFWPSEPAVPLSMVRDRTASPEATKARLQLSRADLAHLQDHRVRDVPVFPAAGYLELAVQLLGKTELEIVDLQLDRGLRLQDDAVPILIECTTSGALSVRSGDTSRVVVYARAEIRATSQAQTSVADLHRIRSRLTRSCNVEEFYVNAARRGAVYGPSFRGVRELFLNESCDEVVARVGFGVNMTGYSYPPSVLDSALHAALVAFPNGSETWVPMGADSVRLLNPLPETLWSHVRFQERPSGELDSTSCDVTLFDDAGRVYVAVQRLRLRRVASEILTSATPPPVYRVVQAPVPHVPATVPVGSWVFVGGPRELVHALCEGVRARGGVPYAVSEGDDAKLREALADRSLRGLLLLTPLCGPQALDETTARPAADLAIRTLVGLLRAVVHRTGPCRVHVVTRNAEQDSLGAFYEGLLRGLAHEHPHHIGATLDLDAGEYADDAVARLLLDLLLSTTEQHSTTLIHRHGHWREVRLEKAPVVTVGQFDANPRGTYLITGGTGALGVVVAKWLVARGARSIVLTGRGGRHVPDELRYSDAAGVHVRIEPADMTDARAVQTLLDRIATSSLPLVGVFHLAGLASPGRLIDTEIHESVESTMPKVIGALLLDKLTRPLNLEQFVLFSSAAGLIGSVGESPYAGANRFLDALAARRRAQGLPAISIAWGPCERGMSRRALPFLRAMGMQEVTDAEMVRALDELIMRNDLYSVVAHADITRLGFDVDGNVRALFADLLSDTKKPTISTPAPESLDGPALHGILDNAIRASLQLADSDVVRDRQPLRDLGLDSVAAIALRERLEMLLGLRLPATLAFDYATPEALHAYLTSRLGKAKKRETTATAYSPRGTNGSAAQADQEKETVAELSDAELDAALRRELSFDT